MIYVAVLFALAAVVFTLLPLENQIDD
jgi:hypothetical protein